ncbi:MAG: nuclear transport factor 2 family protein, partial [Gemmatimonadota bacterium]
MRLVPTIIVLLAACGGQTSPPQDADAARHAIANTLERYMRHARAVNAESVATFFTANGTLFEPGIPPIVTRDSIRRFMASFPGVRVDSATAVPDTIEVYGDTALLWGSYFEKLAFPGQPESEQHGKFVIQWLRQPDATWQIHRYYRIPLPAPPPGREA